MELDKYTASFIISVKKSFAYRFRLLVWFFWDIGPALMMLLFWTAVFKTRHQVAGFDYSSLALYYLVVIFARNLVLTHPEETLQAEIYSGQINVYLPRPINLILMKLCYELAYKFLKLLYLIPLLILLYIFFLKQTSLEFITTVNLSYFFLSSFIGFFMYFTLKMAIGFTSFWFTQTEWLTSLEELVFWFFGGLLLPLELLPVFMQKLASFLPFQYVFYLPAQILLGKMQSEEIVVNLFIQLVWLLIFILLLNLIFKKGLKVNSAFGG